MYSHPHPVSSGSADITAYSVLICVVTTLILRSFLNVEAKLRLECDSLKDSREHAGPLVVFFLGG